MPFRFWRRINLGNGMGLNVSKSGVTPSVRTRAGSLGMKGFTVRTGIPGLSYRHRFGKNGRDGAISAIALSMLIVALVLVARGMASLYRRLRGP